MATTFEQVDRFEVPAAKLVELLLEPSRLRAVYVAAGYRDWVEESRQEEGNELLRTVRIVPRVDLPLFVRKALGDTSAYRERQRWDEARRGYHWALQFDISNRLALEGECTLTDDDRGGCVRRIWGEARAAIPIVGGKLESYLVEETLRSLRAEAAMLAAELRVLK